MAEPRTATVARRVAILIEARRVIERSLAERITLAYVAREVLTSRRQLQRVFHELAGTSFRDEVRRARLTRGAALLRHDGLPVSSVARRVGYREPSQFTKAFMRQYGTLPSAFRRGLVPSRQEAPRPSPAGARGYAMGHSIRREARMAHTTQHQQTGMTDAYAWRGRTVVDRDGEKIGKLEEIYLDQETGRPEWALVNTGMFGMKSNFVPVTGAAPRGEDVSVRWDKQTVKDAPGVEPDGELSEQEEAQLYRHYGLDYSPPATAPEGRDVSGPTTDNAMTRSEEEVRVGTARRERGRARLRKYVVTEEVQQTVPVRREEARIEREPITDANVDRALDGPEISDEEHEVVLHEEQPVVEKRTVPKERVRLSKDQQTGEEHISEEVRKERVEAEGDVDR